MNPIEQHGEPTLFIGGDNARLTITPRGGHSRLEFRDAEGAWQSPHSLPPLLQILRGDFFCFPFGVSEGHA